MTKGIPKKIEKVMFKKIGLRPNMRYKGKTKFMGVVYFPTKFIGKKIKIEVLR